MTFAVVVRSIPYHCTDKYVGDCTLNDYELSLKTQVYVTMYLNDVQRTSFYEGIGLNTRDFDMHVIVEVSFTLPCRSCALNEL